MDKQTSDTDIQSILADLPGDPADRLQAINKQLSNPQLNPRNRLELSIEGYNLAEQLGDRREVAKFLYAQGEYHFVLSDYTAAYEKTKKANEEYRGLGHHTGIGWTQAQLGSISIQMGEYAQAMAYLKDALDIAHESGSQAIETHTLTVLGILHQRLGEYEEAIACFLRGLTIEEELGNKQGAAANLANLAWVSAELGDDEGALHYYQRGLETFRETGWKYGQATTLQGIGEVYAKQHKYDLALASYEESLEISRDIGDRLSEANALASIGAALLETGKLDTAIVSLQDSLELREEIGDHHGVVSVLLDLARLSRMQEEKGAALNMLLRALELAEMLNVSPLLAKVHKALSEHYEMDGDAVRALRHFREYHYIEAGINRSEVSTKTERLQAQLDLERLEKESALARLKTERMESELNVARRVQMSLLPAEPPGVERLDIASTCIPALEVGGDYYDFFQFSEHQLAVAIGDITGKGIPAAIQMTLVKGVLLSHAICDATPKSVLVEINRHLYTNLRRGWFASMIYATIDTLSMQLRYASAGHNPLLVIRNGVVISPERPRGMALGLAPGSIFAPGLEEYEIALAAGDVIVFYTDGYSEAMNESREEYGEDRLHTSAAQHSILPAASSIIESIGTDIVTFIGAAEQHDDMTMIVMKLI